jgi:hypothetical protein
MNRARSILEGVALFALIVVICLSVGLAIDVAGWAR